MTRARNGLLLYALLWAIVDIGTAAGGLALGPRTACAVLLYAWVRSREPSAPALRYGLASPFARGGLAVAGGLAAILVARGELPPGALLWHLALLAPVAEELVWRGMIQPALRAAGWAAAPSIVLSAVAFWALHAAAAGGAAPPHALLAGLALGVLRERTGELTAPTAWHAAGNLALLL